MRAEFVLIGTAFDTMPRITTTGLYDTVFTQAGNYTFVLPTGNGTLATTANVATETTRATAAEGILTTAVSSEATTRAAADTAEATARAAAVTAETTRATAAETALSTFTSHNIGRNRVHNGGFRVNQRAQVSGVALASGVYGHDRWKAGSGGCTYTFTQIQPTTTITITAGTLQQVIEAQDAEGGSYILSWTGTALGRINSGSYGASPVTVTGLSANTAITVEFQTGTVGKVQFEVGAAASAFEMRPYGVELALCQRFYQTGGGVFGAYGVLGQGAFMTLGLPVTMRAAPTVVASSTADTNISAPTMSAGSLASVQFNGTVTATGGWIIQRNFTASADL